MEKENLTPEQHRSLGVELFNKTWEYMENADRSSMEDAAMLEAAFASSYHWSQCGTALNRQRSFWLISRVYAILAFPDTCIYFADLCRDVTENALEEMKDFDVAFSYEALARAYALGGVMDKASMYYKLALESGNKIQDLEDKQVFMSDIHTGILKSFKK